MVGHASDVLLFVSITNNSDRQWQKWLSAILVGINLVMIFFFLPETRWDRSSKQGQEETSRGETASSNEVATSEVNKDQVIEEKGVTSEEGSVGSRDETYGTKKTFIQEINPWSGIDKNTNFLNLFLRPFPLLVYPACAFAVLACKSNVAHH
jgi:hypothetical protein